MGKTLFISSLKMHSSGNFINIRICKIIKKIKTHFRNENLIIRSTPPRQMSAASLEFEKFVLV